MSDTEHPRPPGREGAGARAQDPHHEVSSLSVVFPSHSLPAGLQFDDPLAPSLYLWLNTVTKATKGMRIYAQNNEMLRKYIDDAYQGLTAILDVTPEITLYVREDRLLYGKDAVHTNPDRQEGLPFTFYRNAIHRITFVQGMTRDELLSLLQAIITDYSMNIEAGEDLVVALWRLALPHLRYLTIDAMSVEAKRKAKTQTEREDIERIQGEIEGIVARIYKTSTNEDDIVAGISITKEDLEALKDIRQESSEDLDLLDVATARAIAEVDTKEVDAIRKILLAENHDALITKLMDILVIILFKEQSAAESKTTMELIQQLFDALIVSQSYRHAIDLIARLKQRQEYAPDMKEVHIARHLLKLFSTEARVLPVLNAFNDDYKTGSIVEMTEFLRALGPSIVPILLSSLDFLNSPAHRRLICDLILEHGPPDRNLLMQKIVGAKWFVARDILMLAQRLPLEQVSGLINFAINNEHPKVREHAVGMLRGYGRGIADKLISERLADPDVDVRIAAVRVAAARRSPEAKLAIESILAREDLCERDPRELRLLMAAYAAIAGAEGITILEKVLTPGFFARSKMTDAQIAAAFALASIGTHSAMLAIQKGMRTLNTRVRDACKKALSRDFEKSAVGGTGDIMAAPTELPLRTQERTAVRDADTLMKPGGDARPGDGEGASAKSSSSKTTSDLPPQGPGKGQRSPPIPGAGPKFVVETPGGVVEKAPAAKPAMSPLHRSGPAVPHVSVLHAAREEMPANLPPVPPRASPQPHEPRALGKDVAAPLEVTADRSPPQAFSGPPRVPPGSTRTGAQRVTVPGGASEETPNDDPSAMTEIMPLDPSALSPLPGPTSPPRAKGSERDSGARSAKSGGEDGLPAWAADLLVEAYPELADKRKEPQKSTAPDLPSRDQEKKDR